MSKVNSETQLIKAVDRIDYISNTIDKLNDTMFVTLHYHIMENIIDVNHIMAQFKVLDLQTQSIKFMIKQIQKSNDFSMIPQLVIECEKIDFETIFTHIEEVISRID